MMKRGLGLILIGFLAVTSYAAASDSKADAVKLLRQITNKLASIEKRLQKLEKQSKTGGISGPDINRRGPDKDKLSKIKYPANPTKENIRKYVRDIVIATKGQNYFSPEDMQIDMLLKVGHANLDVLIDAMKGNRIPGLFAQEYHLQNVIKSMVKSSDKKLVIDSLAKCMFLAEIVVRFGWEKDAQKILIEKLSSPGFLPDSWLTAVVDLKDPKTYPKLKEFFITHGNRLNTYNKIKDLPGIKLDDAVKEAWNMVKASPHNQWDKYGMSIIAVGYGNKEALAFLFDNYDNQQYRFLRLKCWSAMREHTDQEGSVDEISKWFNKNKQNIVFDKKDKKFKLKSKVLSGQGGK